MKKQSSAVLTVLLFAAVLLLVPLGWLLLSQKTFSDSERRYLAEFPSLARQDLSDWTFDDAVETYLADHLPLRDTLVGINAYAVLLSGRQVSQPVWADMQGRLEEAPFAYDENEFRKRLDRIETLQQAVQKPVFVLAVPSAGYVQKDSLPSGLGALYPDGEAFDLLENRSGFSVVPLRERFLQEQKAWYYRTDHHWTAKGVFAAYEAFMAASGKEALSADRFYHHTADGYTGSTRSRSALWLTATDTLQIDEPIDTPVTVSFSDKEGSFDSLFFYEHLGSYDWYRLFLDGNHPVTVIENHSADPSLSTLLMVKDSFGNTLAPLLVPSYRRIVLVDPRYARTSVSKLCSRYEADEILFCYSIERLATDRNLLLLK